MLSVASRQARGTYTAAQVPRQQRPASGRRHIQRHWVLLALLAAGLALRVVTQIAYRPALLYIDSPKYIGSPYGADPVGYDAFLGPLKWMGGLGLVAAAQHALGLAMAVALYALLIRRGVRRWAAALATAPVLLDAYQLQMEQTIMPDVMFEALIVAGLVILLWQPKPGLLLLASVGLVLGAAVDVRQVGEVLIIPAAGYVLLAARGWRRSLTTCAVLTAAFAVPVLGYMTYSASVLHEHFQLSSQNDEVLYGRTAEAADCATLRIPASERALCPSPEAAALGIDQLVNDSSSPGGTYSPPPGVTKTAAMQNFSHSVLEQQPLRVIASIAHDSIKLFALTRDQDVGDTPISRWQFQTSYPNYPPAWIRANGGGTPTVSKPLATALRHYQLDGGYTPGPVLLLTLLAGLGGILTLRRGRDPSLALACLLVTTAGIAVLLGGDFYEFSWRYQLPALITLPLAGALGATAIGNRTREALVAQRYPV
jgi:hypothetical protein